MPSSLSGRDQYKKFKNIRYYYNKEHTSSSVGRRKRGF